MYNTLLLGLDYSYVIHLSTFAFNLGGISFLNVDEHVQKVFK